MMVIRHLLSILLLPTLVVVLVPIVLLSHFPALELSECWLKVVVMLAGGLIGIVGFSLFSWCVMLFVWMVSKTVSPRCIWYRWQ